jgi:predicted dehydrogenase
MQISRRTLLAVTGAAPLASGMRIPSPNDNIQIATIGLGRRGLYVTRTTLTHPGIRQVAACDAYAGSLERAKEAFGADTFVTKDYHEILARKDIDAVIIGTPDHWHSRIAIDAMEAGKDVYLEKPMIHDVEQGHALVTTQSKTGRMLQVGSQYTSSLLFQRAREILDSGAIGEITLVEAWVERNSAMGATLYSIPPDATPERCDWDLFQGSAPKRPFDPVRFFRWRHFFDYGTGQAGDLFVHLLSGINFTVNSTGPVRVSAAGGVRFWKDGREMPDVFVAIYDYPQSPKHGPFNAILRVNTASGNRQESLGVQFSGSEGMVHIGLDTVTLVQTPRETAPGYTVEDFPKAVREEFLAEYAKKYPNAGKTELLPPAREFSFPMPTGYNPVLDHTGNFLNAVRTRQRPLQDAIFGYRAAAPALLANTSYFTHRVCQWDPERMVQVS